MRERISHYEAAVLSAAAYISNAPEVQDDLLKLMQPLSGWYRDVDGFYEDHTGLSISIFHHDADQMQVFAIRGTCTLGNIISDIQLFLGTEISILDHANAFFEANKKSNKRILFTGHSLGGAVAGMLAVKFNVPAITFDAPGYDRIAKYSEHYSSHKELVETVLGVPNLVNAMDKHIGVLFFANTDLVHTQIARIVQMTHQLEDSSYGGVSESISQHSVLLTPLSGSIATAPSITHAAAAGGSTVQSIRSTRTVAAGVLLARATWELHSIHRFIAFFRPEDLRSPSYIKKWPNWLNSFDENLDVFWRRIFKDIYDIELSDIPEDNITNEPSRRLLFDKEKMDAISGIVHDIRWNKLAEKWHERFISAITRVHSVGRYFPSLNLFGRSPDTQSQYKSRFDANKEFDKNNWIITLGHDNSRSILGHSFLLVEGINEYGEFICNQYDIVAEITNKTTYTGTVNRVRIDEPKPMPEYAISGRFKSVIDRGCNTTSYDPVSKQTALAMIDDIKSDSNTVGFSNSNMPGARPIHYSLVGRRLTPGPGGSSGINCIDWCLDKLKRVGLSPPSIQMAY